MRGHATARLPSSSSSHRARVLRGARRGRGRVGCASAGGRLAAMRSRRKHGRTWRVGVPARIWGDGVVAWSGQARVKVEGGSADPTQLAPILTRPPPRRASTPTERASRRPAVCIASERQVSKFCPRWNRFYEILPSKIVDHQAGTNQNEDLPIGVTAKPRGEGVSVSRAASLTREKAPWRARGVSNSSVVARARRRGSVADGRPSLPADGASSRLPPVSPRGGGLGQNFTPPDAP